VNTRRIPRLGWEVTDIPEDRLFEVCARKGIGVIARVPLDEGSLTFRWDRTPDHRP
jgi:aryl-alcohol dehydrogenase-like predicted oxidoreductase